MATHATAPRAVARVRMNRQPMRPWLRALDRGGRAGLAVAMAGMSLLAIQQVPVGWLPLDLAALALITFLYVFAFEGVAALLWRLAGLLAGLLRRERVRAWLKATPSDPLGRAAGLLSFVFGAALFPDSVLRYATSGAALGMAIVLALAVGTTAGWLWRRYATWRARAGLAALITLPPMALGAWFAWPGPAIDMPPAASAVAPLDLPDPGAPGPYRVATLSYGSAIGKLRPAYADAADLRTTPVDGAAIDQPAGIAGLYSSWRWGFDAHRLPRNALVWYPEGAGPFPLALILHGNHAAFDPSEPGYAYLGEHLASRGIIAVSVDENFLNGTIAGDPSGAEIPLRAWLLLQHLAQWRDWNADPASPFFGKVDLDRVALIGHSRGGEAVAHAAAMLQGSQGLTTRDQRPETNDQGPGTNDQGPRARDQGPGANDQGLTTRGQRPGTTLRSGLVPGRWSLVPATARGGLVLRPSSFVQSATGFRTPELAGLRIAAIVAIAPSDGMDRPGGRLVTFQDVSYLVLQGAYDADVGHFAGLGQYGRVTLTGANPAAFVAAAYLDRANHGQFNSGWGYGDVGGHDWLLLNRAALLSADEQQAAAKGIIAAFLNAALRGEDEYRAVFTAPDAAAPWLPATLTTRYDDPQRHVIYSRRALTSGEIRMVEGGSVRAEGGAALRPDLPATRAGYALENPALRVEWPAGGYPSLRFDLDPAQAASWGLTADHRLTLAIGPARDGETLAGAQIEVITSDGDRASVPLDRFVAPRTARPVELLKAPALSRIFGRSYDWKRRGEYLLQTVQIPLSAFTGLAPQRIAAVRIVFAGGAAGAAYVDDVGLGRR